MNPNMKAHNKDLLLMVLMRYLTMDVRKKLMMEVPAAYRDFFGLKPNESTVINPAPRRLDVTV